MVSTIGKFKKYARKQTKRAGAFAQKRYFKGKGLGNPNVKQMLSDVQVLKSIINSEKNNFIASTTTAQSIGQVEYNSNGLYSEDITPAPIQGTAEGQRIADSIKLCSAYLKFQFFQQSSTVAAVKFKIVILHVLGLPQTPAQVVNRFYSRNPFVTGATITDYNSIINNDYRSQYKVICNKTYTLKQDQTGSQNTIREVAIPLKLGKYGHHVRYSSGTTSSYGQLIMLVLCDNGNKSPSGVSTLGNLPNSAVNTGMWMNYNFNWYYYDN